MRCRCSFQGNDCYYLQLKLILEYCWSFQVLSALHVITFYILMKTLLYFSFLFYWTTKFKKLPCDTPFLFDRSRSIVWVNKILNSNLNCWLAQYHLSYLRPKVIRKSSYFIQWYLLSNLMLKITDILFVFSVSSILLLTRFVANSGFSILTVNSTLLVFQKIAFLFIGWVQFHFIQTFNC